MEARRKKKTPKNVALEYLKIWKKIIRVTLVYIFNFFFNKPEICFRTQSVCCVLKNWIVSGQEYGILSKGFSSFWILIILLPPNIYLNICTRGLLGIINLLALKTAAPPSRGCYITRWTWIFWLHIQHGVCFIGKITKQKQKKTQPLVRNWPTPTFFSGERKIWLQIIWSHIAIFFLMVIFRQIRILSCVWGFYVMWCPVWQGQL